MAIRYRNLILYFFLLIVRTFKNFYKPDCTARKQFLSFNVRQYITVFYGCSFLGGNNLWGLIVYQMSKCFCNNKNVLCLQSMVRHFVGHPVDLLLWVAIPDRNWKSHVTVYRLVRSGESWMWSNDEQWHKHHITLRKRFFMSLWSPLSTYPLHWGWKQESEVRVPVSKNEKVLFILLVFIYYYISSRYVSCVTKKHGKFGW